MLWAYGNAYWATKAAHRRQHGERKGAGGGRLGGRSARGQPSRAGGGACDGVGGGGRAYCGAAKREGDEGQEEGRRASRVGGGGR